MLIYFPNKTSMKRFLLKDSANKFIQNRGKGRLVEVPTSESSEGVEKWIQEKDDRDMWSVSYFNNTILVDSDGKPLKEQTTKRNPKEPIPIVMSLGKPDYIYCVELD
ncbi:MAG: hypothetical protein QNJ54_06570 [Prochloraceae cyanobacterium]|nr:hypothetical protein [Prochloraceae cyanobacterium]